MVKRIKLKIRNRFKNKKKKKSPYRKRDKIQMLVALFLIAFQLARPNPHLSVSAEQINPIV